MKKSLPTAAEFNNAIISFIAANDKTGCEEYINSILKSNGRPRLAGHRTDAAELKVATFLLTWKVQVAKYLHEAGKHMTEPKLAGELKYFYDNLCEWNNVDELPDYSGSYALAVLNFMPLNITYK